MISFAVIIQARMNSSRLPGKTLMDLGGKSILQHQIDSIKKCPKVDLVIVATSDQSTDDPIYDYCKK
ncbi:MAG: hypothetical protein KDD56_09740, partial [Bdellovibrionales bacterium]|nr:hypothetical protein [Bdellovibrionales bacterium]